MHTGLAEAAASVGEGIEVETHLRFGEPVTELLAVAHQVGADAIVITIKNRSRLGKLVMGSKAQEIILRSDVPVLTVPRR
jgi:nucleotide-binding universal stress UspA family protein